MIRIIKITGPVRFSDNFDRYHPHAKHVRRIQIQTPIDISSFVAQIFSVVASPILYPHGIDFIVRTRQIEYSWFVPCEYDHIHFDNIPNARRLNDLNHAAHFMVTNHLHMCKSLIHYLSIGPFDWRAVQAIAKGNGNIHGTIWLLDAFVWKRLINDGDNRIGFGVLRYLITT